MIIEILASNILPTIGRAIFRQAVPAVTRVALSEGGKKAAQMGVKLGTALFTTAATGIANKKIEDDVRNKAQKKIQENGGLTRDEEDELIYKGILAKSGATVGIGAVGIAANILLNKSINSD